ncbi:MAG: phospho-N-acetylmuramoyl-pentapeptide-transferase, partial [Pyrinomonadaceae bacterium]
MIYYFIYELLYHALQTRASESYFVKALNVFQYVTFRTAYATITSLLISLLLGDRVIKALRNLNIGQQIREEGPQAHMAKRGTPTMGGVLIIGSVIISTLLWARLTNLYVWFALIATLLFAAVGFVDDYAKITRKQSLGLTAKKKLLAQFAIAVGVWMALKFFTDYSWNVNVPFIKATAIVNGISNIGPYLYLIFAVLVLLGFSNAVNLTDGLDGLAIGVTFIAMTALTAFTYLTGDARFASYLDMVHRPEAGELTVFCGALSGASLGFLWFNSPPAEVFMGDVGSLAIGGAIGTIGILTKQELILVMVGGVFVFEALSVMLQVSVYKLTRRRIFKMSPIHHHFELAGWRESKVVFRFLILAVLFALFS